MRFNSLDKALLWTINTYGKKILLDKQKLIAILSDIFPSGKSEKNILSLSFTLGIPDRLYLARKETNATRNLIFAQCTNMLSNDFSIERMTVEQCLKSFSHALGWNEILSIQEQKNDKRLNYFSEYEIGVDEFLNAEHKKFINTTCDIFSPFGVNQHNSNFLNVNRTIPFIASEFSANGDISRFIVIDSSIVFWTQINSNMCTLNRFDIVNNKHVWLTNNVSFQELKVTDVRHIHVMGEFILTHCANCVYLHSAQDGKPITRIESLGLFTVFLCASYLIRMNVNDHSQQLDVYKYPYSKRDKETTVNLTKIKNMHQPTVLPIINETVIYFVCFNGNIVSLDFNHNKILEPNILYCASKGEVDYMLLHDKKIFFSLRHSDRYSKNMFQLDINSGVVKPLIHGFISLETTMFSAFEKNIVLCENYNNSIYFTMYMLSGEKAHSRVVRNAEAVKMYYVFLFEGIFYIIYLCKTIRPGNFEVRQMNFQTGEEIRLSVHKCDNILQVSNMYNHILVASLKRGSLSIHTPNVGVGGNGNR